MLPRHPEPISLVDRRRSRDETMVPPLAPMPSSQPFAQYGLPPWARLTPLSPSHHPLVFPHTALVVACSFLTTSDSRSCRGSFSGSVRNLQWTVRRLPLLPVLP